MSWVLTRKERYIFRFMQAVFFPKVELRWISSGNTTWNVAPGRGFGVIPSLTRGPYYLLHFLGMENQTGSRLKPFHALAHPLLSPPLSHDTRPRVICSRSVDTHTVIQPKLCFYTHTPDSPAGYIYTRQQAMIRFNLRSLLYPLVGTHPTCGGVVYCLDQRACFI